MLCVNIFLRTFFGLISFLPPKIVRRRIYEAGALLFGHCLLSEWQPEPLHEESGHEGRVAQSGHKGAHSERMNNLPTGAPRQVPY